MNFLNTAALWHLAWIAPLFFLLYFGARAKRQRILSSLLGTRASDESFSTLSKRARFIRFVILGLAFVLLVVAIARPCWGMSIVPFTSKGRDILFAIDVSKSMLSKDVQPSRIDHAKWFARQIVKSSQGDRFGLIAFAGTASLDCPLTTDMTSFNQVLSEIEPGSAALGGTNIQAALETALKAFNAAESGHRAVVLVTDGDELTGNSTSVISQLKAKKIPLFIAGVGDPSKPGLIPVKGEDGKTSFMRDASGELVKSALNEKQLSELALGTGGIYVRSTVTTPGTEIIENRIRALVPKELENGSHSKPIERFQIPLIAAIVLIFIWFMIPEKKKPPRTAKGNTATALIFALIPFLISFSSDAVNTGTLKKPLRLSVAPENPTGALNKNEANKKEAELKVIDEIFNKARELHEKSPQDAVKLYQKAINEAAERPDIRAKACQNLGVIQHYNSRNVLMQSLEMVKKQNLDGALKNIDSAMKEFDKTEEFYRQAMASEKLAMKNNAEKKSLEPQEYGILSNQQKLLNDRASAENLKKKIEELKKKQEEAQKKTQEAKNEQQKANQDKQQDKKKEDKKEQQQKQEDKKQEQKKDKQKEEQSANQDKQQKQGQQDKKEQQRPQDKADQARSEAQKSVDDLKKKADDLGQKNMSDSAKAAQEELKKAEQSAEKNKGKEAEKHIDKALEKLGRQEQNNQDKNDKNDQKNNKDNKDKNDKNSDKDKNQQDKKGQNQEDDKKDNQDKKDQGQDQKPDKKLPDKKEAQAKSAAKAGKQEKEIDEEQAEALLELMAGQEKNLRDAIKEYQKKHYQQEGPEKDW